MTQTLSTLSERMLADYFDINGYKWDPEPDLGIRKHPDFLVTRANDCFVCEVKEFEPKEWTPTKQELETIAALVGRGVGASPAYFMDDSPRSVCDAIKRAAKQLKGLAGSDYPLVIVLANPYCAPVDLAGPDLVEAIAGTLGFKIPFDSKTGKQVGPIADIHGRGGKLTNDHQYISAIVGLHRREDGGDPEDRYAAHVVHARSKQAKRIPLTVFNGPHDRNWIPSGDGWHEVRAASQ